MKKLHNVHVNLKVVDPLPETNNLLLYDEFDGVLEIDPNRSILQITGKYEQ